MQAARFCSMNYTPEIHMQENESLHSVMHYMHDSQQTDKLILETLHYTAVSLSPWVYFALLVFPAVDTLMPY